VVELTQTGLMYFRRLGFVPALLVLDASELAIFS